ncbi:transposase [Blautia wexlerae]|uniref:transposase n=1 Tax=Blautia wexlerae TaxID=418240 RepID=UPI0031B9DE8A
MDRGYPSTAAFIRMMEKGILFLARLKSSDYKKEQAVMAALGHVTLRMVKVPLPDNKEEILITNLPSEIFDHLKIAELYLMRWNKEGYFSQSSGFFYDNSSVICRNYRKCMGIMQNRV